MNGENEMYKLTENQEKLAGYLKGKDFETGMKLAIGLCCDTDEQAKAMLEFCQENPEAPDYAILQKAVEISSK